MTVNRDLKIKIGQIAVAEVQNILTKRNKKTMKAEVSVVKIKNCKFFDRDLLYIVLTKGQQISKGKFGVFKSTKKPLKLFKDFCTTFKMGQIREKRLLFF